MGAYAKDEKLLIHFSQESLTRVAATWYTKLEPSRVHSWKDLMVAFVRQYQCIFDMALDRMQLQDMCKKGHESFKEYTQRWRDLAAQVAPPMTEKEMITIIVDTLLVFYYEKWWGTHLQVLQIWSLPAKGLMWVQKEANLIILLGRMRKKLGQMKRVRMWEKPML